MDIELRAKITTTLGMSNLLFPHYFMKIPPSLYRPPSFLLNTFQRYCWLFISVHFEYAQTRLTRPN